MAGIVLLLPLVFFRGGQLWRLFMILFFFIFAQDHGWGVEAIGADGGAGSTNMERTHIRSAEEFIYIHILTRFGVRCARKKTFRVYIVLKVVASDV